jgi:beta-N-acetylhexosaminidase
MLEVNMFKKISLIILFILVLLTVIYLIFWKDEPGQNQSPSTNEEAQNTDEGENSEETYTIDEIFSKAKDGMIIDTPFVAGQTEKNEVIEAFGEPKQLDRTTVADYANYPNKDVTIGYQNSIIVDLRSYHEKLQKIHYEQILDSLGEPQEVKYYQDQDYDQIILIYKVNEAFQLKWVLDKPTDDKPNPNVHHISVVAMKTREENKETDVTEQLEHMSLDEKLGQLIFAGVSGTELSDEEKQLIHDYKVGGIIFNIHNITSPSQTVNYINQLKAENTDNIPLFFGIDQEGGRVAKIPGDLKALPTNLEIGEINNSDFSFEYGNILGKLVRSFGFNVNFAPVLDINSNPNNPVIGDRSFGNNPDLVSKLGIQTMKGIQDENIIPTIKHFPGHGDTSVDSHLELPVVNKTLEELEALELIPFENAINEGADMVMIAHILLPKLDEKFPSSMSKVVITELLREKLGFSGVVITDDMTMEAITDHYDIVDASVESIKAGTDIIMVAHHYENIIKVISSLKTAVEAGEISEERIDESVTRILKLKRKYKIDNSSVHEVDIHDLNQQIENVLNKYMN